jgi:hypothetical protein
MVSMMSGFPLTPIISFIYSFLILSILDFLADLLSNLSTLYLAVYLYQRTDTAWELFSAVNFLVPPLFIK